jgi:hypothetical protein
MAVPFLDFDPGGSGAIGDHSEITMMPGLDTWS